MVAGATLVGKTDGKFHQFKCTFRPYELGKVTSRGKKQASRNIVIFSQNAAIVGFILDTGPSPVCSRPLSPAAYIMEE
jgi:hypothetical protein